MVGFKLFETFSFECKYGMKLAVLIGPCLLFLSLLLTVLYDTTPVVDAVYFQPPIYLISMSSIGFKAWIISPAQRMMERSDSRSSTFGVESIPGLYKYVLNPLSNFIRITQKRSDLHIDQMHIHNIKI